MGEQNDFPDIQMPDERPTMMARVTGILGSGIAMLVLGVIIGAALIYGLATYTSLLPGIGNKPQGPTTTGADAQRITELQGQLAAYQAIGGTPQEITQKVQEATEVFQKSGTLVDINAKLADLTQKETEYHELERKLAEVRSSYDAAKSQEGQLTDEVTVMREKRDGLTREVDRLQELTGQLEEANARRQASKQAVMTELNRLIINIKESIPVTPKKYRLTERVERAEKLKTQLEQSNWVAPDMMSEFSEIIQTELDMAADTELFLAYVPVKTGGTAEEPKLDRQLADVVLLGRYEAYYRTVDGKGYGKVELAKGSEPGQTKPAYEFNDVDPLQRAMIDSYIQRLTTPEYTKYRDDLIARQQAVIEAAKGAA